MKKGIIITITLCFLVFLSLSVYSITVGHNAENIWPGIFNGSFTIDGLLNVTGNIIASEPVDSNHVATKSYVDANGGGSSGSVFSAGVDWSDCEVKSDCSSSESGNTITCSSGYNLVDHSCSIHGFHNSDTGYYGECKLTDHNSLYIKGMQHYSTAYLQSCGSIKCCKTSNEKSFTQGGEPYFCSQEEITSDGKRTRTSINEDAECLSSENKYCDNGQCNFIKDSNPYLLYVTTESTNGNMGGRSGADSFCRNNKPEGIECSNIHAFLSISDSDEIRDMPSNYYPDFNYSKSIYWVKEPNSAIRKIGNNWSDILDGSILLAQDDGTGNSDYVWTFTGSSVGSFLGSTSSCNGGTDSSSSIQGIYARYYSTDGNWIGNSFSYCYNNYPIRCMCEK